MSEYLDPIDMLPDQSTSQWSVHCPVCGHENSHMRRVYTRRWRDADEAQTPYEGTHFVTVDEPRERRGAVVVELDGECEHRWALVIQQHKGTDYVTVERLPDDSSRFEEPA